MIIKGRELLKKEASTSQANTSSQLGEVRSPKRDDFDYNWDDENEEKKVDKKCQEETS